MHIMEQLNFIPQLLPQVLEQLWNQAAVRLGIPRLDAVVVALRLDAALCAAAGLAPAARPVGRLPWHAYLHSNVAIPLRLIPLHALFHGFERAAAGMAIRIDRLAALAAEQLMDGQPGPLA